LNSESRIKNGCTCC